jgi:hypothetical protein
VFVNLILVLIVKRTKVSKASIKGDVANIPEKSDKLSTETLERLLKKFQEKIFLTDKDQKMNFYKIFISYHVKTHILRFLS